MNQIILVSFIFAVLLAEEIDDKIEFQGGENVKACEKGHNDASTFQVCSVKTKNKTLSIARVSELGQPYPVKLPFEAKWIFMCDETEGPIFGNDQIQTRP